MKTFQSPLGHPGSGERSDRSAFARLAGIWFLGLSGLYALYTWTSFVGLRAEATTLGRLIMVAGPMTFALSLLVAPAVFAAARDRFDLFGCQAPGTRARQWVLLVAFALAAYVLSALDPAIAESLVETGQGTPPEPAGATPRTLQLVRFALPVTVGLLILVAGCAGALVGHVTRGWRPRRRDVAHWFACLALVASFLLPLLIATSLIMNRGYSVSGSSWVRCFCRPS